MTDRPTYEERLDMRRWPVADDSDQAGTIRSVILSAALTLAVIFWGIPSFAKLIAIAGGML